MGLLSSLHCIVVLAMFHGAVVFGFVKSSLRFHVPTKLKANWASTAFNQVPRSEVPSRYDICKLLLSGVVGTDPKEIYLKSGHYVVNFALAVVGHFRPVHQQEQLKPAETMWLSMEMWDDLAKKNYANIKKGRPIRGVGYVIQNKWTDKETGEERKMYKVRITKMIAPDEFEKVSELLADIDGSRNQKGSFSDFSDTGFSSSFPDYDNQICEYDGEARDRSIVMPTTQLESDGGYTYRKLSVPLTIPKPQPQQHNQQQQQHKLAAQFNVQSNYPQQWAPQSEPQSTGIPSLSPAAMPPPGAGGDGQKVWESLQNEYPGMVKPMQRVITPMSREPSCLE